MEDIDQPLEPEQLFLNLFKDSLIDHYFLAIVEVNKKGCNLSRDDKLKLLLTPVLALSKLSLFNEPIPFTDETIDLEHELDLTNLDYDRSQYIITSNIIDPLEPCIYLTEKNEFYSRGETTVNSTEGSTEKERLKAKAAIPSGGGISLMDLHEKWLPNLTQETIKSKDLLNQVLVAYTIKKAQNGEDNNLSASKLFDLYKDAAQEIAKKIYKKFASEPISNAELRDAKRSALEYLRFLIQGFNPRNIIKGLIKDKNANLILLPLWMKNFFIEYLSKYVPQMMALILKEHMQNNDKRKKITLDLILNVLLNPHSPIVFGTLWKGTPKRISQFNKYCYRPEKMGPQKNLTTWLFGTGMFYQLLKQQFKELEDNLLKSDLAFLQKKENEADASQKKQHEKLDFDSMYKFDEEYKQDLAFEETRDDIQDDKLLRDDIVSLEEISDAISSIGISKRDIDIFYQWKVEGLTQQKLANRYSLSVRQIKRICHKIKSSAPALKHLI